MAGKAVGALEESLNSFKLGGSFLSFNLVNALDKLMQSNPDSFTRQSSTSAGLWREAVFKVFCAICFFAASKITYKQFLTQKKQVSYPKCI
jgi:hypothetical protein